MCRLYGHLVDQKLSVWMKGSWQSADKISFWLGLHFRCQAQFCESGQNHDRYQHSVRNCVDHSADCKPYSNFQLHENYTLGCNLVINSKQQEKITKLSNGLFPYTCDLIQSQWIYLVCALWNSNSIDSDKKCIQHIQWWAQFQRANLVLYQLILKATRKTYLVDCL